MSYIKAEEILPEELIRQIQEYGDGGSDENRPNAGYPRGNYRTIRPSSCCVTEEGID